MADSRTQPNVPPITSSSSLDLAWRAVIDATQGAYEVLVELARDGDGAVAFVAKPVSAGDLAILKLEPEPVTAGAEPRYTLFELKKLDETVPAPRINCPVCAALVAAWRGRCPACGSAIGAGADGPVPSDVLLAFYQLVSGRYEVIGELATEGAGPPAYLVRGREGQQYAVLRLALGATAADGGPQYLVDVLPLAAPGGATPGTPSRIPLEIAGPTAIVAVPTPAPKTADRVCPQCGATFGADTLFCPRDGASLRPVTSGADLVGQLIDDRYYIEQRLGEGGMGEVYIAHQVRTGRKCALKLMHRTMTQDPDAVGRFRREAASACAISHPNVATIFDSGETLDRRPYFAMEFVDGRSLSQVIRDEGPLDPWRTADIGRQIAEGLAAAHDLDIVHRDLKPDNVMLGAGRGGSDYVKLVDFGIAKPTKTVGNTLTRTGFILGTPAYMSPEQLCADKLDGRTDLYSLGCVLYEMLTGETPFSAQSLELVMMRRLTEDPPHPRAINGQVPPVLDDIVTKLLARSADERYPDARAAAEALGAAQDVMQGPPQSTRLSGYRGAANVRMPTPGPRAPGSIQVTAGNRPPRRSRDDAPPPPLSPPIPFRSPALGIAGNTVAPAATTVGSPAVRRRTSRWLAGGAAAVVLLAGGLAAWSLTRKQPAVPAPVSRTLPADSPRMTSTVKTDSQPSAITTNQNAITASARDSVPTAAKTTVKQQQTAGAQPSPSPARSVPAVSSNPITGTNISAPPIATTPRDTKTAAEPVAAPTPLIPEKPRVDAAAEAERAEAARVRASLEAYVRAIGEKRIDALRQIFPGMNEESRNGFEALFRNVSDLSIQLVGAPTISVHGATADAEFAYDMSGRDPSRGNFSRRTTLHAKLQRTDQGWILISVGAGQ
jgi:serine/threonine protein kinase